MKQRNSIDRNTENRFTSWVHAFANDSYLHRGLYTGMCAIRPNLRKRHLLRFRRYLCRIERKALIVSKRDMFFINTRLRAISPAAGCKHIHRIATGLPWLATVHQRNFQGLLYRAVVFIN